MFSLGIKMNDDVLFHHKMAELWSEQHIVSSKGFCRRQHLTYSMAEWIKCRACDLYIPKSNPAVVFVVTYGIEFISIPKLQIFGYLTYMQFIFLLYLSQLNTFFRCVSTLSAYIYTNLQKSTIVMLSLFTIKVSYVNSVSSISTIDDIASTSIRLITQLRLFRLGSFALCTCMLLVDMDDIYRYRGFFNR